MTRLLVIRLSALGDVIHTLPAVMSLRHAFDVSWAVETPYAELVQIVAGVTPVPVSLKRWSLNRILDAKQAVSDFDLAVDFQGLIKSALLARVAAPQRFGFAKELVRERPAAWFYNQPVTVDRTKHVVDWNVELAARLPLPFISPHVNATSGRQHAPAGWNLFALDSAGKLRDFTNKIVLLPGAGRPEKQWPVERFRELAKRYGDRAVVAWGPGERDLAVAVGGIVAPETNLRELAFLLQKARLVVGGDTGPLHLADALGTRVVGLYGPTDPGRNGPYGQLQRTIRKDSDMASIAVEDVMKKIDEEVNG